MMLLIFIYYFLPDAQTDRQKFKEYQISEIKRLYDELHPPEIETETEIENETETQLDELVSHRRRRRKLKRQKSDLPTTIENNEAERAIDVENSWFQIQSEAPYLSRDSLEEQETEMEHFRIFVDDLAEEKVRLDEFNTDYVRKMPVERKVLPHEVPMRDELEFDLKK